MRRIEARRRMREDGMMRREDGRRI